MQMMAHLARECLEWDPDSRLTMSPGMSTRKSMHAAFFMYISKFDHFVVHIQHFSNKGSVIFETKCSKCTYSTSVRIPS
ncbi:receptor-like serine/threonine-protein kinase NCRK [Iris pallida]|uniref:Receptor-like serine/threonine-protein kinase NCRK n=1 Tax=Iris pallida TaxID=29817 RepID=A0AAX6E4I8_IRIPA|nr:receptor-like serine/threonine-protein kinase NCRK [Iris pallida]